MVDTTQAKGRLATLVLFLANILWVSESSLVIGAACTSALEAWLRGASCKSGACCKVVLCWLGAVEAATLAPSKEARSLAILESVIGSGIVALGAGGRDSEVRLHARGEFVMVDTTQAKGCLATLVLFLTNILRVSESSLVAGTAGTSALEAWL